MVRRGQHEDVGVDKLSGQLFVSAASSRPMDSGWCSLRFQSVERWFRRRQAEATEWMAKQVRSGKTAPVSNEEARDLIGLFTSPVVGAPKPGAPEGTIRTCHHLSSGGELSINEGIDFDPLSPIGLLLVDSVVSCVRYMRRMEPTRKIRIAKFDMEGFFRQIPLRRRGMARVTQRWNGVMNVHTAVTFGARSAPHVCSVVTNALCDEMARLGHFCQYYFVDDCVIVAFEEDIQRAVDELRRLVKSVWTH